jgi:uncharacterized protein (TIGR00251 family)
MRITASVTQNAKRKTPTTTTRYRVDVMHAIIDVRVIPRSGKSGLAGRRGDALLVRLNAPPVDGAANAELVEVLARALGVPRRAVSIVAGERSRQKRVRIEGVTDEVVDSKLNSTK